MKRMLLLLVIFLLPCMAVAEQAFPVPGVALEPEEPWTAWCAACVPVYDAPKVGAVQTGWLFHHTPVQLIEESGGFVRFEADGITGWLARDCVHIGSEITEWDRGTMYAQALETGMTEFSPLYAARGSDAVVGEVSVHWILRPICMTMDGEWLLVQYQELTGWMPSGKASLTNQYEEDMLYCPNNARRPLYAAPSLDSAVLGEYYTGVRYNNVWADYKSSSWQRVSIAGTVGWLYSADGDDAEAGQKSAVDWYGLPPLRRTLMETLLLTAPDEGAEVLGTLAADTPAEIIGVTGSWAHIRLKDGRAGYAEAERFGGVPDEADSPYFTLTADVIQSYDQKLIGSAGTTVRIEERPRMQWLNHDYRDENGQWHSTWQWQLPEEIWTTECWAPIEAIDTGW